MEFEEVIRKRRTIRRFKPTPVPLEILKKLVDYARIAPQGSNNQALEYVIITNEEMRSKMFANVRFASALQPEMRIPEEGRRPMAYIVVLLDSTIKKEGDTDCGAAVENILLGITYHGLGACWQGAIDQPAIHSLLELPEPLKVQYVISIGYPDEESQMEEFNGDFKYWKTDDGKMHVPKKSLEDVIFKII
ncbi:MAG: nitroreductase [Promethearchaeota archaeon]|nr:MAG: nitroreductase [Candidatus Lokiarchaeota archaeon]